MPAEAIQVITTTAEKQDAEQLLRPGMSVTAKVYTR